MWARGNKSRISPMEAAVVSVAQQFVNSKIQPGKVVVFIKPTCSYCRRTQQILCQLPFKQGFLEFVNINAARDTRKIQDYLEQLTGARTVPRIFISKHCIGGCSELIAMHENGELWMQLKGIRALQL
uniref:Glutaredoxin domain-containing protein n=1 Tax=Oryctolagus cuniculus TaxID=9986 RepID=G1TNX4_RABIT|nr:glutaredoxin-1-like isoform X1 [Oryctolagus cuniculus]XP_017201663.1 glutaredoxin-1-like isoform X1 [Oryctolagus cuniculus]XP_051713550.1 glutaredoxin-1-like isoform X1 [Oryctolagus cuniculus]XP_051713551.1 glutaredoxin-1-like isoform X1 [Oryctolagus cuniculus]XP_051713552.1 glutaredoxin-1-like isoform X1 [Oryctolagus cuniculus]XP_051713553.1 glutaredoxin-1-like isoform X1 [Oryctolagus cuniculus]XP_051713554.1 glutaredoxin-1-like isoform X1 [Oryctolagus cuniculus]XP_051713555.1 glutaredox